MKISFTMQKCKISNNQGLREFNSCHSDVEILERIWQQCNSPLGGAGGARARGAGAGAPARPPGPGRPGAGPPPRGVESLNKQITSLGPPSPPSSRFLHSLCPSLRARIINAEYKRPAMLEIFPPVVGVYDTRVCKYILLRWATWEGWGGDWWWRVLAFLFVLSAWGGGGVGSGELHCCQILSYASIFLHRNGNCWSPLVLGYCWFCIFAS